MAVEEIEKSFQELKDEAVGLGLDVKGLKSKKEVIELIEKHYESQSAGDLVKIKDETETKDEEKPVVSNGKSMGEIARELKEKALKTKVVRITNNDKRDNSVTNTVYLSAENQYWGISKIVPLDEPVELEQCLINCAKNIEIMNHVDEVVEGKRTGNKVFRMVKKYSVSLEDSDV